ncbi:MAG: heme biosynthesis HemY N-terminal domain-containing protein [Pseudomonadota bacterium]
MDALSIGLVAIASGDAMTAQKKAKIAEKSLQRPELTRLLNAQAAELSGDSARAETYYKALMSDETTAFAGAQGLLGRAMAEDDTDRALKLAEHAHELMPKNALAMETLYTLQSQKFDWAGARRTVQEQKRYGLLPKDDAIKREAALVYAQSEDAERDGNAESARKLSVEAARMDPSNVEAVSGAVGHLLEDGSKRAASKLIVEAWRIQPHPKLAAAYAAVEPDEAPAARRRRFQTLFAFHPDSDEVQFLRAELALVDEDWTGARKAIEDLRETEPSARSCAVFAAIARGEGQPDYVVQGWLARGLGAPRTPGSDSAISNAAMLPLLMGTGDTEAMSDVTEPAVKPSSEGSSDAGAKAADVSDAETVEPDDTEQQMKSETVS